MKQIRNLNDLSNVLMPKMRESMIVMQNEVYDAIHDFMILYYTEPVFGNIDPTVPLLYNRTYDFFKSLTKSKIRKINKGWECCVYIDFDSFDGYEGHTPYEVVDMINRGFHADTSMNNGEYKTPYDIESKYHFWDDSIEGFKKGNHIINVFINFLRSRGIKVELT